MAISIEKQKALEAALGQIEKSFGKIVVAKAGKARLLSGKSYHR